MTGQYPQDRYSQDHAVPIGYPTNSPPRPRQPSRNAMYGAYAVAVLALAAVAVTIAMFLSYKDSASAQLTQMREQVSTMNQELQNAQSANTSSFNGLSGKVSSLSTIVGNLAIYGMVCTQGGLCETRAIPSPATLVRNLSGHGNTPRQIIGNGFSSR